MYAFLFRSIGLHGTYGFIIIVIIYINEFLLLLLLLLLPLFFDCFLFSYQIRNNIIDTYTHDIGYRAQYTSIRICHRWTLDIFISVTFSANTFFFLLFFCSILISTIFLVLFCVHLCFRHKCIYIKGRLCVFMYIFNVR